jgi:beta-galactosidase
LIDGQRLVLYSGEFHYWRLPSVGQWRDRLEKMKAAGLNAVSIYFSWQYHSSAPGQYDFSGVRDINQLLDITDQLGLYVIARVGPYMNAEADAGGLPGWVLRQNLSPRSQTWTGKAAQGSFSPLYAQYSQEWYDHVLPILATHQVTTGGSVLLLSIENEYPEPQGSQQYMQALYTAARTDGISVPIFHNDFYFRGDWKSLVDLYGQDSYPYGFQCCHQWWDIHFHGIDTWAQQWRKLGIKTPMFVSELQGGGFDPWGGQGYAAVAKTLNGDWLNVIDQSVLAQGTTMLNTYMFVGGTSWGYMSFPGVYTSYDYGAPISESGALRPAYYAAHRIGSFLQSFGPQLAGSDFSAQPVTLTNTAVVAHSRTDPVSGTRFIFLRYGDARAPVTTRAAVPLPGGTITVPQKAGTAITVPGHGAETLVANASIGPLHLNYSTSQIMTAANTAAGTYLVLYGARNSDGETSFALPQGVSVVHNANVTVTEKNGELRLNYRHTSSPRTVSITTSAGTVRLIITDTWHASRYWTTDGVLIGPADLVEDGGNGLEVADSEGQAATLYGRPAASLDSIDGATLGAPDPFMGASPLGSLSGPATPSFPTLDTWKFQPEAPEINPAFDDSSWTPANHTTTSNPNVPSTDTLLADDYGFHYGFVWYRGHFTATGTETKFTIRARQSFEVFLNGTPIGEGDTNLSDPPHTYSRNFTFSIPPSLLKAGQDNVIAVLTESLGHDEGWLAGPLAQSPQGILTASIPNGPAITWRLQGDAGGEQPSDTERGLMNASGLYGERNGWYQPNFDDSSWSTVTLPDSWSSRSVTAPIGWYRTHFTLNLPAGQSTPVGLVIPHASDKAVIWLNGWLVGRYWEQKGPQHEFYLPQGILNPNGDNVLAIAVWNRGHAGGLTSVPSLAAYPGLASHHLVLTAGQASAPGYWHTEGNRIVDAAGRPIRIAAVNWFGMENKFFVPAGLDDRTLDSIVGRAAGLGFNAIRLPFSNQVVEENPVITGHIAANPTLKGLHALDIMDRIVASAQRHGLRVILDDGRSSAGTQPQGNGLWYTSKYPESAWIADWQALVTRYDENPTVVGVDLRNEPHTGPPGPWTVKAYLTQGSTWGPYQGVDNPATDWRLAAERGGNAVLAINPHLLIFVEGLQLYPDSTQPDGIDSYWWGGILTPAKKYPVKLDVDHQLVYSPHEYGPFKYPMSFFGPKMSYQSMVSVWQKHWGFLDNAASKVGAPIFIGEFGTCGNGPSCVTDSKPGSQGLWFTFLMRYLKQHPEISWSFWALNGTSHLGDDTKNYILAKDWRTIRVPLLVDTLRDIEQAPPPNA